MHKAVKAVPAKIGCDVACMRALMQRGERDEIQSLTPKSACIRCRTASSTCVHKAVKVVPAKIGCDVACMCALMQSDETDENESACINACIF